MHSLKKSVKPEIVNSYDLWVLRHKIGGAKVFVTRIIQSLYYSPASCCSKSADGGRSIIQVKVFVNNVQWSDQMM
jgi:hypothetical protein